MISLPLSENTLSTPPRVYIISSLSVPLILSSQFVPIINSPLSVIPLVPPVIALATQSVSENERIGFESKNVSSLSRTLALRLPSILSRMLPLKSRIGRLVDMGRLLDESSPVPTSDPSSFNMSDSIKPLALFRPQPDNKEEEGTVIVIIIIVTTNTQQF